MSDLVDDCMDEVLRLDSAGRHQDMLASLSRRSADPSLMSLIITRLWRDDRFEAATCLANALLRAGNNGLIPHLARAIGGLFESPPDMDPASVAALTRHCDTMADAERDFAFKEIFRPVMWRVLTAAHDRDRVLVLLRLAELIKPFAPVFRDILDWDAAATAAPTGGGAGPRPPIYRSPPPGAPRVPYRVVVAIRGHFLSRTVSTRLLEIGPRFVHAACAYGWPAMFLPMTLGDQLDEDFRAILTTCERFAADILILDDDFIADERTHAPRQAMIAALRQSRPSIKVVALHLDCWQIAPNSLRRSARDVDAIWATTPAMPHWRDPEFTGKILHAPLAHAGHVRAPAATHPERISFVGRMLPYNWPRILWRAACVFHGLPIAWELSYFQDDGLSPLDSYAEYMRRLPAAGAALNLAMRDDLSYAVTDRSFEALLTGTLLIQEAAPDMDHFFIAGEHYLPFRSFTDLRRICELLATQPSMTERIRRAGHEFAVARYADEKLMGYLDALLFHPERQARTPAH